MKKIVAAVLLAGVALGGCSSDDGGEAAPTSPSPSPAPSITPTTASPTAVPSPTESFTSEATIRMCSTDLPAINERIVAVARGVQSGSTSGPEAAAAFRQAEGQVTELRAEVLEFPALADGLQDYADVLEGLRLGTGATVAQLVEETEQVGAACFFPSGDAD